MGTAVNRLMSSGWNRRVALGILLALSLAVLSACRGASPTFSTGRFTPLAHPLFSPDGKTLLVRDYFGRFVQHDDLDTGERRWQAEASLAEPFGAATFSPDGSEVVVAQTHRLRVFSAQDGSLLETLSLDDDVREVPFLAYRADGTLVLAAVRGEERTLSVEVRDRQGNLMTSPLRLPSCDLSDSYRRVSLPLTPDGRRLFYTRGLLATMGVVDLEEGRYQEWDLVEALRGAGYGPEKAERALVALALSPDGTEVALDMLWAQDRSARVILAHRLLRLSLETGEVLAEIPVEDTLGEEMQRSDWWSGGLAYTPDGRYLVQAVHWGDREAPEIRSALVLYDLAAGGKPRFLCKGGGCEAGLPAFAPDGSRLAVGLSDGTVHLWEVKR